MIYFRLVSRALQSAWDEAERETDGIIRRGTQIGIKSVALKLAQNLGEDTPEATALLEWLSTATIRRGGILPGSVRAGVAGVDTAASTA